MICSHLRWIRTPLPIFSSNLEELRGPSFSTLGGNRPPLPPLPAPLTEFKFKGTELVSQDIKATTYQAPEGNPIGGEI